MTPDHLTGLMKAVGYDLVKERSKNEKGVSYWLWQKGLPQAGSGQWDKKVLLAEDGGRNNFCVLL